MFFLSINTSMNTHDVCAKPFQLTSTANWRRAHQQVNHQPSSKTSFRGDSVFDGSIVRESGNGYYLSSCLEGHFDLNLSCVKSLHVGYNCSTGKGLTQHSNDLHSF